MTRSPAGISGGQWCSDEARQRGEPLAGTASHVRAFLLVEHPGPWGHTALLDARLPEGLGAELRRRGQAAAGVRILLARTGRRGSEPGVRVFAASTRPGRTFLESDTFDRVESVLDLDLSALAGGSSVGMPAAAGPLYAVCTQGRHDACCARRGRPVAQALRLAEPARSWECSHMGGDRFAGNLLVLPWGLYYGALEPELVAPIVEATERGEIVLDSLRGRSCYPMAVQAGELALRRELAETAIDGLAVGELRRQGTRSTFVERQTSSGRRWQVRVATRMSEQAYRLTCTSRTPESAPEHHVESIEELRS